MTTTKSDLIIATHVTSNGRCSLRDTAVVIECLLDEIVLGLKEGDVLIKGFGTFYARVTPAKPGRNIVAGEPMVIPQRVRVGARLRVFNGGKK